MNTRHTESLHACAHSRSSAPHALTASWSAVTRFTSARHVTPHRVTRVACNSGISMLASHAPTAADVTHSTQRNSPSRAPSGVAATASSTGGPCDVAPLPLSQHHQSAGPDTRTAHLGEFTPPPPAATAPATTASATTPTSWATRLTALFKSFTSPLRR